MSYRLRCTIFAHDLDVRCLAVSPDGSIISGSRDKTAKVWQPDNDGYVNTTVLKGHGNFVSSVCALPPSSSYPWGLIVTGCNDNVIRAYTPNSEFPVYLLEGHSDTVCSLTPAITAGVLSASWDKTAKLWNTSLKECSTTFVGHKLAVWTVIQLPNQMVVTGSADKTVRTYTRTGDSLLTLTGHTDCVRDLDHVQGSKFVSCSNDATIRMWDACSGACLSVLSCHPNYIYSVSSALQGNIIVSGGEDRYLNIQKDQGSEHIYLPAQSVWCVRVLPNTDIVAGLSDGTIRVFSADPLRQADAFTLKSFTDEVNKTDKGSQKTIGGIKASDLPGLEALMESGKSEGQLKMINEPDGVKCYSWSMSKGKWELLGDVTGANNGTQGDTGKVIFNGLAYDYVFTIDVEEGKPPLKLPYNSAEDPWLVAQRFIHKHNLSQHYLEEIALFIVNNSQKQSTNTKAPYQDPLGVARYIPGQPDPESSQNDRNGSGNPEKMLFPQTDYLRFDHGDPKVILGKLEEFNRRTIDGRPRIESHLLVEAMRLVNPSEVLDTKNLTTLTELLVWPADVVFPVIDVARLAVRNAEINRSLCSGEMGIYLMTVISKFLNEEASEANKLVTLRLLSNMFLHAEGENLIMKNKECLYNGIMSIASKDAKKTLQVALGTLALNLSISNAKRNIDESDTLCFTCVSSLLPILSEPEAMLRALVALGTLLCSARHLQLSPNIKAYISQLMNRSDLRMTKVADCCNQILNLLKTRN